MITTARGYHDTPKVYGYARVSTEKQDARIQRAEILKRFNEGDIPGEFGGTLADEGVSGWTKELHDRPHGKLLLSSLRKGDAVIITHPDRLGRNIFDGLAVIKYLFDRGIRIYIISMGGRLDLSDMSHLFLLNMLLLFAQWFSESLSGKMKESYAYRRDAGLPPCNNPRIWERKEWITGADGKKHFRLVNDERQCQLIREIYRRKEAGETYVAIARDFYRRGETTGKDKPWVKYIPRSACKRGKYVDIARVRKAYLTYQKLLENGEDLTTTPSAAACEALRSPEPEPAPAPDSAAPSETLLELDLSEYTEL